MKFSIIIPAHNEEHRLPSVLEAYAQLFSKKLAPGDVEILVVANGSTDRTAEVATEISERHPLIKVIDEPRRIGKGGAVILGAKQAIGDWIGFVDADGATSAEEFFRLYGVAQRSDGVIASRWMRGSDVSIPQKGLRLFSSRIFNLLIRTVLGLKYTDTQCGAKIFKASAWKKILPSIGITRFAFDVDVLFQLKREAYQIVEEPTTWRDVEGSKVQVLTSSFDMFSAVIRMRLFYSPFRFMVQFYERCFARLIEYLRGDKLFCHTVIIFFSSMLLHVCNVGFQMLISRSLSPSEYALLASFLAALTILQRPLGSVSTAVNHYVSILSQEGRKDSIKKLIMKWVGRTGGVACILMVFVVLFSDQISSFLHLERKAPVIVSAFALPALFIMPVLLGSIHGLQRFGWGSFAIIIGALVRVLVAAVLLVALFPTCGWTLVGHASGLYISCFICLVVLYFLVFKFPMGKQKLPSLRHYLSQSFFIQISCALLMSSDVVLVNHYLPAETDFAYAATLGRMVGFISIAVASAMFPKVSSDGRFTKEHRSIYFRSLLYSSILIFVSITVCALFPAILHRILFKISDPSASLLGLTRGMAVVAAITTLLNINVSLLLAQRRFKLVSSTIVCALFYMVGVYFFHDSPKQVVYIAGAANLVALIMTTLGIYQMKLQNAQGADGICT